MVNIHGLLRAKNIEFGRDLDTGGQTRYVVELARHLSDSPIVEKIEIASRLIVDKRVAPGYGQPREAITEKADIVRLPCGGQRYIQKEKLWPYLDEYTDRLIQYIREQKKIPDFVHGHYADAGYIASQIAKAFGIPLIFTGHSLGRNKLSFLLESGWTQEEADKKLTITKRIRNEEEVLSQAQLVISSTDYERTELYGQYINKGVPSFAVIPPGLELDKFFPYYHYEIGGTEISEPSKQAHMRTLNELRRFHFEPDKPLILSLCRPDARKNIDRLIDVYGRDKELQAMANLAIFAGIREDISTMEEGEQQVLTDMLMAMDKYDLYGKMAIPKYHNPQNDVPELYRIAALKRGVFVSTAYLENFGLTFIEASASGLPFIGTEKGGPRDIQKNCGSGKLVDIDNDDEIASAMKEILTNTKSWNELSENGINRTRNTYTWENHCKIYLEKLEEIRGEGSKTAYTVEKKFSAIGKRFHNITNLLIVDIDDTLLGDDAAIAAMVKRLNADKEHLGFGVATGRPLDSTLAVLKKHGVPDPDVIITSVGSEIYYVNADNRDNGWSSTISRKWKPDKVLAAVEHLPFLSLQQQDDARREFKISFNIDISQAGEDAIPLIHDALMRQRLAYNIIFSHNSYVDILPSGCSKGHAIRYISQKWKLSLDSIITAGNSGNDWDMLSGGMKGIVVSNHEPELEGLKKNQTVYFASSPYASGVLEGLDYWLDMGKTAK